MNAQSAADTSVFNSPNPEENRIDVRGDPVKPPKKQPVTYPEIVQQQVPDDFVLGNDRAVAQARMAEESTNRASDRKGLFGTRGTLRDILGTLGDFFLVGGGGNPMYAPMREREKWADALQGMTAGPEAERAAFERAMRINPEATLNLMKERDYARTQQGHLGLRSQEYIRNFVNDARKSLAGIAATDLDMIAGGGANVNQTLNRPLQEERVDIARGNLDARNRAITIAAQRLGLDRERLKRLIANDKWDEFVDLIEIALEVQKESRRSRKANRRSLPKPPSGVNRKTPMFRP
jgi:hypothetical protein